MRRHRNSTVATIVAVLFVVGSSAALAQTAVPLLREDDPLPGAPGETVDSLNNPVVNHAGGFALTVNTSGSGTTLGNVWGNATGGPGTVIITEGTYGNLQQTSFESFHGLSNAGDPAYSASSVDLISGTTGLDGVWVGPVVILNEEDPVPTLPGQFSTFNSRPGITADGIPYWVGGISTIQGGSSQNRVLFFSGGLTPVLMGGDAVGGVPELISTASSIDFDFRFSALGMNYITPVSVDASSTSNGVLVINGDAAMFGGSVVREASPLPASIGGLPGENWDNFDYVGITESGQTLVTGDTDASTSNDEFVAVNGEIVLREGDMVETVSGMVPLAGSIEGGYLNEDGDWAVTWDVDDPAGNIEALIFNGEVVLRETDEVDLDGDGNVDPGATLANFTGLTALVIGDRGPTGIVPIYFTADIDTQGTSSSSDDIEVLYRLDVAALDAVPLPLDIKPGSCPNPFNPRSNGVLPVWLVGTMDFDVTTVDLATLEISRTDGAGGSVAPNFGPPGPGLTYEDAATPFEGETCDCGEAYGDGIIDLGMKFPSWALRSELGLAYLPGGEAVELQVTGLFLDGAAFEARDCVVIVGNPPAQLEAEYYAPETDDAVYSFHHSPGLDAGYGETRAAPPAEPRSFGDLAGIRDVKARLRLLQRLARKVDRAMLPLIEDYLLELIDDAEAENQAKIRLEAERLLARVRR